MNIRFTALLPVLKHVYVASLIIGAIGTSARADAASLTGTLTQPVGRATNALTNTLSPATESQSASPVTGSGNNVVNSTLPTTTATTVTPVQSTISATTPVTTAANAQTTAAPSIGRDTSTFTAMLRNTAAQSAATANSQSSVDMSGVNYDSNQISPATAKLLYQGAAAASIGGFGLYAASALGLKRPMIFRRLAVNRQR